MRLCMLGATLTDCMSTASCAGVGAVAAGRSIAAAAGGVWGGAETGPGPLAHPMAAAPITPILLHRENVNAPVMRVTLTG